ncbi:toxin-antitoxin system YwqK family antitoxin [Pontibacter sp. H249]|uniref:toxin-antitoxin system YwqK family antitoxin n=1 Tax=Pontibacter sp. H249 TaxID=3133420 RepID=UPI0030BB5B9E
MRHSLCLVFSMVLGSWFLTLGGCGKPKWNSDYNLNQARLKENSKTNAIASVDTSAEAMAESLFAEKVEEKEAKRKKKHSKRYFLGEKVKRGFTKRGNGSREEVETFSYLPGHKDPNPYAPLKYYFDTKKKVIYRTSSDEIDAGRYKILHGPYKKEIDGNTVEEGYYYIGTRHLRWETYRRGEEGILVNKQHYEKGFQRDAIVTYYDGSKKIKEVMPYEYGQLQGTYYRFYENGEVEWTGKYEKGRKVGVWIKHYDFRGRRHYEYQYPETAYDKSFEPFLVKEYDRHGTLIYEKDKFDKRSQAQR